MVRLDGGEVFDTVRRRTDVAEARHGGVKPRLDLNGDGNLGPVLSGDVVLGAKARGEAHLNVGASRGSGAAALPDAPHVAEVIARRKQLELSQAELDQMIGVSESMVAKWESKARFPGAFFFMCWAKALGVRLIVEEVI